MEKAIVLALLLSVGFSAYAMEESGGGGQSNPPATSKASSAFRGVLAQGRECLERSKEEGAETSLVSPVQKLLNSKNFIPTPPFSVLALEIVNAKKAEGLYASLG